MGHFRKKDILGGETVITTHVRLKEQDSL
jgi:hypothetical protein